MPNKFKILIIDDEASIRNFVSTVLDTNGYKAICAESCAVAQMMFLSHKPDLILLDLGLPDYDGTQFIKIAREVSNAPIVVLSARTEESDKVQALDLGANDYITKPFSTVELLARVRAALRVVSRGTSESGLSGKFRLRDLVINYDARTVTVGGDEVKLTQTEYNVLTLLSHNCGKVMTYTAIIREIWGASDPGSTKKLQVNMANIRKKLRVEPGESKYIINELGVGYRMREPED